MSALEEILEEFETMSESQRAGKQLDSARYEIFASHVSMGQTPTKAYRVAFGLPEDAPTGGRPAKLLLKPEIRQRIGALLHQRTEMLINRSILTERNIMDELAWGIKNTREAGKYKEHHSYVVSTAKILGMFIETDAKANLADKSLEELREEARLLEAELGIPASEQASEPTSESSPPSLPSGEYREH